MGLELQSLVQIFGASGVTFYVMWLWLKSVQKLLETSQDALKEAQEGRLTELKGMLPLLSETSKALQEIVESTSESNQEIIKEVTSHIDKKIIEVTEICKLNK